MSEFDVTDKMNEALEILKHEIIDAVKRGEPLSDKIFYIPVIDAHVGEQKVQIQLCAVFNKIHSIKAGEVTRKNA